MALSPGIYTDDGEAKLVQLYCVLIIDVYIMMGTYPALTYREGKKNYFQAVQLLF